MCIDRIMSLNDQQWDDLLSSIKERKCTPFVGAGASSLWLPLGAEVAQKLAMQNYNKDLYPKTKLSKEIKKVSIPNFASKEYENTAYSVLADLPFPIYITTNYDYFM